MTGIGLDDASRMPRRVQDAILKAAINHEGPVRAFWLDTMDPDERPVEANMDFADFLKDFRTGALEVQADG